MFDLSQICLQDCRMERSRNSELPRGVKAVIFDMDGVIFETERMYQQALAAAVEDAGGFISRNMLLQTVGLSWAECQTMLSDTFSHIIPTEFLVEKWRRGFDTLAAKGLPLKRGLLELLDTLDLLSLPRAIATSAYPTDAHRNLNARGIFQRFDTVVAHGDCKATKPAPDPFILAAARLNVDPSHCLAIEDSIHGVRSAFDAGMMTVMVPDTIPAGKEEIAQCVRIASDLHEVRMMLLGD